MTRVQLAPAREGGADMTSVKLASAVKGART